MKFMIVKPYWNAFSSDRIKKKKIAEAESKRTSSVQHLLEAGC